MGAASFETLVRRASSRRRLPPLLRALGFEAGDPAPIGEAAALGGDGVEVLDAAVLGVRGGLALVLVELAVDANAEQIARVARRLRAREPTRPQLFLFATPRWRRLVFASFGLDGELRQLAVERRRPLASDAEALGELAARPGETGVALALRHARALDRSRLTRQFFRDFRAQRARLAEAWQGLPRSAVAEREQLALLLLCRLMFLYFLQRRGQLGGDLEYLPRLLRRWQGRPGVGTFFRALLLPLFFAALNTRPEARDASARALGAIPYLNGGLFERHALERRFPELDLGDDVVAGIFDGLMERYRFTARDAAEEAGGGIDPEMLGRVFEELMAAERRGSTGTFFTPAAVVDRVVRTSLEAWFEGRPGLPAAAAAALAQCHPEGARATEGSRTHFRDLTEHQRRTLARELSEVRVLDPACGSGAFLLGALAVLAPLRASLAGGAAAALRRDIIGRALHGVDVQEDAALLCALRLWLALTVEPAAEAQAEAPPPLPNLDRRIRQGDALVDPLDLIAAAADGGPADAADVWRRAGTDARVRSALRELGPLGAEYLGAGPETRPALQRALAEAEVRLARCWLDGLEQRLSHTRAELAASAAARDLFGESPPEAARAATALRHLSLRQAEVERVRRALEDGGALPFFSFRVHFADAAARGFDLVLSNPPWVRAHRWPAAVGRLVRRSYEVCRAAGWRAGSALARAPGASGGQVDLSLLFLERSLALLRPGGVVGMLLPAKSFRSLYGAGARRLLLRDAQLFALEDHSLDQRSIFRADAFAGIVIARKNQTLDSMQAAGTAIPSPSPSPSPSPNPSPRIRITMIRRGVPPLRFTLPADELPLVPGDPAAPWLLAPPAALAALRRMQSAGPPLGARPELHVRRGVVTGANEVLVVREATAKLGGLAWIRAEGWHLAKRGHAAGNSRRYCALMESSVLAPMMRGADVGAWRFRRGGHVLWIHDDVDARPRAVPPRAARYLTRHAAALEARSAWHPGLPPGCLFSVSPDTLRPKVAWHDLAETLNAVALPARVPGLDGARPLVPLNTVYFIPVSDEADALLIAALFNSLPVRTFARAAAERAKDARFRFQAWTIAALPLPLAWPRLAHAPRVITLARVAHERGSITSEEQADLDAIVAGWYGLEARELEALAGFDAWLRGERSGSGFAERAPMDEW